MIKMMVAITASLSVFISISCNNRQTKAGNAEVIRDTTITPSNAYSPLFLDSATVDNFIMQEVTEEPIAQYIHDFYNTRNYSFAWFNEKGLTAQAQGFWSTHNSIVKQASDSSMFDAQLHQIVDTLLSGDSTYPISRQVLKETELRFTRHFFKYIQYAYAGKVNPEEVQWHIPRRKLKPVALLDSFIQNKNGDWKVLSKTYYQLQQHLLKYSDIERNGGWTTINGNLRKLKPGDKDSLITSIKKRLQVTGLYNNSDTSAVYNTDLAAAVKQAQESFGLRADGIVNTALVKQLNIPVAERIKQMLLNMERMKWMPGLPSEYLLANIPEYRLHVVENGKEVLGMNIVVGKAANRTVIFSDALKYIVFSPYWNVPRSIVRNEIYPAMSRSSSYLRRNNMEVTGYSGGLPVVRQRPGNGNALGHVKFIFPNSYDIYFHDTPSRSLFDRQQRAFSHGCIRLQQPFDLAVYLLKNNPAWTPAAIGTAMNSSTEKWVTLDKPVPVFITYFTSWVDNAGILHFVDDIYGHDKELAKHLFE